MAKYHQMLAVHRCLRANRYPVSTKVLMQELECSTSTIGRIIAELKNTYNAPIKYDRNLNGYYYDDKNGETFEMPGMWFNESELYALLVSQKLLLDVETGLFEPHIKPLLSKINKILENSHHHPDRITDKVSIVHQAHRPVDHKIFQKISSALLEEKQLKITFYNRQTDTKTERNISPLKLVYYRDNWYLDAWCHSRSAFRSFSVINISKANTLSNSAQTFSKEELENYFASAYGIFSGAADKIAILHFTPFRARWVAEEQWHPKQQSRWLPNGYFELKIPYGDHRELIMDILKYGADVTVQGPTELKAMVKEAIENNLKNYAHSVNN